MKTFAFSVLFSSVLRASYWSRSVLVRNVWYGLGGQYGKEYCTEIVPPSLTGNSFDPGCTVLHTDEHLGAAAATPPAFVANSLLAHLAQLATSQLQSPVSPSTEVFSNLMMSLASGGAQQLVADVHPQEPAAALVAANPSLMWPAASSFLPPTPSTLEQQSSASSARQAVAAELSTSTLSPVTATASGLQSMLLPDGGVAASDLLAQQFPMIMALAQLQHQQQPTQGQLHEQTSLALLGLLSQVAAPPTTMVQSTNQPQFVMPVSELVSATALKWKMLKKDNSPNVFSPLKRI